MKYNKIFLLTIVLIIHQSLSCLAQNRACGKADVFYRFVSVVQDEPEDSILKIQYNKLYLLEQMVIQSLSARPDIHIVPITASMDYTKNQGYLLEGFIGYDAEKKMYLMKLFLQTICSHKVLAEPGVLFQMYPTWDHVAVGRKILELFNAQVNIASFEASERQSNHSGLGGDLWGGKIEIQADQSAIKGKETTVLFHVYDCDGATVPNSLISTKGSIGGVFTPAQLKTDVNGVAMARFKITTDKTAIIKAQTELKNVWGCQDLYTGTTVMKGVGGVPVMVEVDFSKMDSNIVRAGTIPGVRVKGGEESEFTTMFHRSVVYYFPSSKTLSEKYLIDVDKEDADDPRAITVSETGWFMYIKRKALARFSGEVNGKAVVEGIEQGSEVTYQGSPGPDHRSEIGFYLGDQNQPATFLWLAEYPASNDGIASGVAQIEKGQPGVKWTVRKIKDPKSPYKTEYLLEQTLDAAEELKKGNKALKELFGANIEEMVQMIDPTKPKENVATATGKQYVRVRILSPYE